MTPLPQQDRTYLVTGAAGFIGANLCGRLLAEGKTVVGVDNLNDYYSVSLKRARLSNIGRNEGFTFVLADIANKEDVLDLFQKYEPSHVVHLAAQAGVRYSLENPDAYVQSNIVGFFNILEACRKHPVEHLIYASSSSVYGANTKVPFEESDQVDQPVSLYAATKRSNEMMAYSYSNNYRIPATGLRFFTVYGPMGRPDMAYFGFTDRYFAGQPIEIYNNGDLTRDLYRDFTYIDDIVEGIIRVARLVPDSSTPHRLFNIGNNAPVRLMDFVGTLEAALSKATKRQVIFKKEFRPLKTGDVPATYASTSQLEAAVGFSPSTPLEVGLERFADWYIEYYEIARGGGESAASV